MSAASVPSLSVLLPAATVAVFSLHPETIAAVQALVSDWRFTRVKFDLRSGDVNGAMAMYAQSSSPNLLIIDTDTIDANFTAQLEQLAGTCAEGTNAVVVGPFNDVALYRYLINMGVTDYLVRPITTEMIADVIARTLLEQLGASQSQLISVIGAKGGTGTSMVAGLLGYALGEVKHEKTVVFDAAMGRSYLSVAFGLEPVTTLSEAARAATNSDPEVLNRMLQKVTENLRILATGNEKFLEDSVTLDAVEKILDRLLISTPYVIVDLSGASPAVQKLLLSRSQKVLLVSQPTLSSLRLARTLMAEIKELKGGGFDNLHLFINMAGLSPGAEVGRADIEAAIDHKVAATFAFDPKLVVGAEAQSKILGSMRGSEKMIGDLLSGIGLGSVTGDNVPKVGPAGLMDSLFRKVGK